MPPNIQEKPKEIDLDKTEKIPERMSTAHEVEDKAAIYTEFLNELSGQIVGFITKVDEVVEESDKNQPIPGNLSELQSIRSSLQKSKDELEAMDEQYLKVLQDTVKKIEEFKLTVPNDLLKLESLIVGAAEIISSIRKNDSEVEKSVRTFNDARVKLREAALKEAGFDSFGAVGERYTQLMLDINTKRRKFFGLGALFNKDKIRQLQQQQDSLQEIQALRDMDEIYHYSSHKFELENSEEDIVKNLIKKVGDSAELAVTELAKTEQTFAVELTPALINELNNKYIEIVRDDLAESMKESRKEGQIDRDFGTKTQREQAIALLRETFDFDIGHRDWGEPEEVAGRRNKINADLEGLPSLLRFTMQSNIGSGQGNDIWVGINNDIANYRTGQYLKNLGGVLDNIKQACDKSNRSSIRHAGYGANFYQFPVLNEQKGFSEETLTRFDTDRWEVLRSNEQVKKCYGEKVLEQYKTTVEDKILGILCETKREQIDYQLTSRLIELRSVKSTPLILLDAFRVGGHGGGRGLIETGYSDGPEQTDLYKYISSLDEADIKLLKKIDIPGVAEIVELIRDNKENFCLSYIVDPTNEEKGSKNNPVFEEIQKELERVGCYYLINGTEQEKLFVLRTIQNASQPMGEQVGPIRDMLLDKTGVAADSGLKESVLKMLLTKFKWRNDFEALAILTESGDISNSDFDDVLTSLAFSWDNTGEIKDEDYKKNIEVVGRNLKSKIEEMSISQGPAIRFISFVVARKLGLELRPSANDIILFFKSTESLKELHNSRDILSYIIGFGNDVVFTDSDVSELIRVIADNPSICNVSDQNKKPFIEFINKLPTSETFGSKEIKVIASAPEFLTNEDWEQMLSNPDFKVTKENWTTMLDAYTLVEAGGLYIKVENQKAISRLFSNEFPENRELCLKNLQNLWSKYLSDKNHRLSVEALVVCGTVHAAFREAGDLKYITALANLIHSTEGLDGRSKTVPRTQIEIIDGLSKQEQRMSEGHWSEDDKAAFYNISNSIIKAAPSLYTDFLGFFGTMSGKDIKKFNKDLYPLYQANLTVLEKADGTTASGRDLVPIRKRLEEMKVESEKKDANINSILEKERAVLISSIQKTFEKRFGLLKIPDNLNEEHIRMLQNCVRYVGNINNRNQTKEALVSLYLGLSLNGVWEDFRSGTEINLKEYFTGESLKVLQPILEKRAELNKIQPEIIGLSPEETMRFQKAMQDETISNMIGNVQTIDIKLGNAKRNLEDLADPDIYPEERDRAILALVKDEGKFVGSILSKIYAETIGKKVNFSENENATKKRIGKIYNIDLWTPAKVKEIQNQIQVPNLICSVLRKLEEEQVDRVIDDLQNALVPSKEIVDIFNSFGEEFKITSGALALSQDLSYLENIIVKNGHKLSPDQKELVGDYFGAIRSQMSVLESVYTRVKENFEKIIKGAHVVKNEILSSRLQEIEKVLYQTNGAISVTTRVTNNINLIIENMRQCLGCLTKEINNDTNLTFGDFNKFYVMSQGEREKGSIADEIVFFAPIKMIDGSQEMSFILDRVYGSKSSEVLLAHIKAVVKKYISLKKDFSGAKTSVLVTSSSLSSVGLSMDLAEIKIKEMLSEIKISTLENAIVTIPESALGDHYVEFGNNNGRYKGETSVSGLKIEV